MVRNNVNPRQMLTFRDPLVELIPTILTFSDIWGPTSPPGHPKGLSGGQVTEGPWATELSSEGGGGGAVDRAPLARAPPPPKGSIDGTLKILPRLTPGPRR